MTLHSIAPRKAHPPWMVLHRRTKGGQDEQVGELFTPNGMSTPTFLPIPAENGTIKFSLTLLYVVKSPVDSRNKFTPLAILNLYTTFGKLTCRRTSCTAGARDVVEGIILIMHSLVLVALVEFLLLLLLCLELLPWEGSTLAAAAKEVQRRNPHHRRRRSTHS